jgi:hypothetical protein
VADADRELMLRLLSGYFYSQTLYVFAELRIADRLRDGPRHASELAHEAGADPEALQRLLRALAALGVLVELADGRFDRTALGSWLDSERDDTLHELAVLGGHPLHWGAWGKLLHSVTTGGTAFAEFAGRSWFEALAQEPTLLATVQRILGRVAAPQDAWLAQLELERFARIIDVGGGFGELARAVARAHPAAALTLFDRPEVIAAAPLPAGIARVAGDFFARVPASDAYLLRFVLHDWDDAAAHRILARCRESMHADSRLFVIESVLPEGPGAAIAKTHDVNMLVLTGGRERTRAQYRALLHDAGLAITRHLAPSHGGPDVLEATPT